MSFPQTLFVSDLDGTLLDGGGRLSSRTRTGLAQMLDAGLLFTVASARSHFSITKLFGDLPLRLPIIEFNGAFITDYRTGEHYEINSLGPLGQAVFDRVIAAGQRPFVCSYNGREDCLHYDQLQNPGMQWYEQRRRSANDPRLRQTLDLRATMQEEVVSLTVMDQNADSIQRLHRELREAYGQQLQLYCYENEYSPGTWWLTIHHQKASKHIAMRSLRDRWAAQATIVALGDNVNDLMMLQHADHAVAVENAVPELLCLAHEVIGPHHSDSVVAFLERRFRPDDSRQLA